MNLKVNCKQESPPAWTQEAYRPPRSHSNFLLFRGGGGPLTKIFVLVWTCIKPNMVSKIFPFTGVGGGGPSTKNFFPVWTCIKPNLVSKIFPFTGGGGGCPSTKKFFPSLNMYQAKSGVKIFSLYWDWVPPPKIWDLGPPPKSETWDPPKKSETWDPPSLKIWDLGPPPKNLRPGTPPCPPKNLRSGTPLPDLRLGPGTPPPPPGSETGTWDSPPPEMWTDWKYNLPSSFGWRAVISGTTQ